MKTMEKLQEKLNSKELAYWKYIKPQSGVLFLKGRPGEAKSAILKSIATKMNLLFIDLRLATMDETDMGGLPVLDDLKGGHKVVSFAVPKWAVKANNAKQEGYNGALIAFEEANRCSLAVRNAAMGIWNERIVNSDFKFNDDVYMCAAGNIGDQDGTDVEEFDMAQKGRLITVNHRLDFVDWKKYYADKHVWEPIVSYLNDNLAEYYPDGQEANSDYLVSPRTWTNLSQFFTKNYGPSVELSPEIASEINRIAKNYVGTRAQKLYKWLTDIIKVSAKDVINRSDVNYKLLKKDQKYNILGDLKKEDFRKLNDNQYKNVCAFLKTVGDDELVSFLHDLLADSQYEDADFEKGGSMARVQKTFAKQIEIIVKTIKENLNEQN